MRLLKLRYQILGKLQTLSTGLHKPALNNLAYLVTGIAAGQTVRLPQVARHLPLRRLQIASRVERLERVLQAKSFVPMRLLAPVAAVVLRQLARRGPLVIAMDRSFVNHTINLLYVAVAFHGRCLPLGWVNVGHKGQSSLEHQQALLGWLRPLVPPGAVVTIVADREFNSVRLADWIGRELGWQYVLRIKHWTWIEAGPDAWAKARELAEPGYRMIWLGVQVTKKAYGAEANFCSVWREGEQEPWLLVTNLRDEAETQRLYAQRFWIEEMFSDHKKRGLNLASSRITDHERLERLIAAVVLAYVFAIETGCRVVAAGRRRHVDNRGRERSVSLCQLGLRWISEALGGGVPLPRFTLRLVEPIDPEGG